MGLSRVQASDPRSIFGLTEQEIFGLWVVTDGVSPNTLDTIQSSSNER